ncbi:MAG: ATP-dependent RecD-like DNA helicase [Acidobacteria bacterium]|nr:ATP-dependent RecD-like DNA helicase [Acidobacteriota bacterium]
MAENKNRGADASAGSAGSTSSEGVSGVVERVTYHDPESGFTVIQLRSGSRRDTFTVIGKTMVEVRPGEIVQASGAWGRDPVYGPQFRATELRAQAPDSVEGIEKYLASGVLKGVGKATAKRLVAKFGRQVFNIIEDAPKKIAALPGIGKKKAEMIIASWGEQKSAREIMVFLHSHGIGAARATQIFKRYGADAISLISEDPYRLASEIRGIGFETADSIAMRLGVEKTAMSRARAGVSHALSDAAGRGHCGLPFEELVELASRLLEIPPDIVTEAIELELQSRRIATDTIRERRAIFLGPLFRAEAEIARAILGLREGKLPWPEINVARAIPWVEKKLRINLSPTQKSALATVLGAKVSVITGGPGVGKTTLLRSLIEIVGAKEATIALAAPTGRAAKRLAESTGLDAKTIHRLLEVNGLTGQFQRNELQPLECDLVVIDEASMIDVGLMSSLLRAIPENAAFLLVGDVDQLPSVGPGQVLADIIESGAVPVVRLTEIFRQSAESTIITNAHRVNHGEMPELDSRDGDFFFVPVKSPEEGQRKALKIVTERIPEKFGLDPRRDVQVLSPMIKGGIGTRALNLTLQQALNPPEEGMARVEHMGFTFTRGDKVMQVENDYDKDVYNGDIGVVRGVSLAGKSMEVEFDGRGVRYDFSELDKLTLAYATTIHKSQGSEYPAVVVTLGMQHFTMLQRRLLYTAITRGRRLVVVVGEKRALEKAVESRGALERWSRLGELLRR